MLPPPITVLAWMPPTDQPPLTVSRMLTAWTFDPVMVIPVLVAAGLYLWGVRMLRRRGDTWPPSRTAYWFFGLVLVFVATSSALGVYDRTLFVVPAIQHMLLQMIAPVGLAMGAPITLAMRTFPVEWRRVVLAVVHSGPVRFIGRPGVAFALFAITQFAFYYTPLYEASLRNVWLHDFSHVHFVLVGFLFYWALLGVDPVPHRPPFFFKFMLVLALAPMHILLGIPIMLMNEVLAEGFYLEVARTWGPTLLDDQAVGGGVLWGFGDVAAAALISAFVMQWYRSDERDARRTDRALDRQYGSGPTMPPWWLEPEEAERPLPPRET